MTGKNLKLLIFIVFIFGALPAMAAPSQSCYTPSEAEAEQAIRIHSELMVIGLNCQHMASVGARNLYSQYHVFTEQNEDLFSSYEDELLGYFRRQGRDPERALHDLRTAIANEVATDAASMRPDLFCRRYAPRIRRVSGMSRQDIRNWASAAVRVREVSRPVCGEYQQN